MVFHIQPVAWSGRSWGKFGVRRLLILFVVTLAACNLQQGAPTTVPTLDAPAVEFLSPINGSSVVEGTDLTIELVARDAGRGVSRVELLVDDVSHQEGEPVDADSVPTFTVIMNWLAEGQGFHSLTAVAYRPDGTPSQPAVISIHVVPRE
jgi:hypothetical protein